MIVRIWHGMVPVSKADEYLKLMQTIDLPEYRAMRGNSRRVVEFLKQFEPAARGEGKIAGAGNILDRL
jgi:hypothetical protein